MKRTEVSQTREISGNVFYVRPFGAWKAANIGGEVIALLTPMFAAVAPLLQGAEGENGEISLLDVEAEKAAPHLAGAMSGLSGAKVEGLLKKLLTDHGNVSVQPAGKKEAVFLTEDMADEMFSGAAPDMFLLAFDVLKANYGGFFGRLGGQFGSLLKGAAGKA